MKRPDRWAFLLGLLLKRKFSTSAAIAESGTITTSSAAASSLPNVFNITYLREKTIHSP